VLNLELNRLISLFIKSQKDPSETFLGFFIELLELDGIGIDIG
jgi:hypothetical protein